MLRRIVPLALVMLCFANVYGQSGDALYKGFLEPGNAARPRVWWHWMNGNISRDGIRKDLLWMHRSGIGGFQNFDASLMTPQVVEKRLVFMTPEWKDAFRMTTHLADSLKLEMAIAASPGWSETGGPWVKPEDAMKKLVWSTTRVTGGGEVRTTLPAPPSNTGFFQDTHAEEALTASGKGISFYKDVAVIAYKVQPGDLPVSALKPAVSASSGSFTLEQLTDGNLSHGEKLMPDTVNGFGWIQFAFAQPHTVKAISIVGGGDKGIFQLKGDLKDVRSLEVSDNGQDFRFVCHIPASNVLQQTINVPTTTGRYFRIVFKNQTALDLGAMMSGNAAAPKPVPLEIAEIQLHTVNKVDWVEEKAGFAAAMGVNTHPTESSADAIAKGDVIDLTKQVKADGSLEWNAPAGEWNIIRFGYSLTGKKNGPASAEATGLEVDKLDGEAVNRYFDHYLNMYKDASGGLMGERGLQYVLTDSWEAGMQNWTANMREEFRKRRGYDMLPWMPVFTGSIIESAEASDRFLWDFRKTLGEMFVEYHYDGLTNILKKWNMKRYSESHEDRRVLTADGMDIKRTAAVPMSAMWTNSNEGGPLTRFEADIRESASVAHIYGQNIAAAESLTSMGLGGKAWSFAPRTLKPVADLELASGLNRFVIHTSVHHPVDEKIPGLGLAFFGQWFNRHETWSGYAKWWTDYLARSSYMLQQGQYVADVAYYYGEDDNVTSLFGKKLPDIPEGYQYDFVSPHALMNMLTAKDGQLVTKTGMKYKLLVLDSNALRMSVPVLRKISEFVKAGVAIAGVMPVVAPGLTDDKAEFDRLVKQVWGSGNPRVFTGTAAEVLHALKITPDMRYTKAQDDSHLMYVHRTTPSAEIYWVNNRTAKKEECKVSFRVKGKVPELWRPETGKTEAVSYMIEGDRTTVDLALTPEDAVFIVFRGAATKSAVNVPVKKETELFALGGTWTVSFQPNRGAPEKISMDKLSSWTEHHDEGVKYFSGTGTYSNTFDVNASWLKKGNDLWLDLGDVRELAELIVNGRSLGVVWRAPYRVNLGSALKPGKNELQIRVTNLWVNRLIGDEQPNAEKITYTTMKFYNAASQLLTSGLLGPVRLVNVQ